MPVSSSDLPASNEATTDVSASSPVSSSGAQSGGEKSSETLVDRFRAVTSQGAEEGATPSSREAVVGDAQETKPPAENAGEPASESELTDAELKLLNPKTQRRIQTLLKQRNDARGEVSHYRRGAEAYDQLVSYVQRAGLSTDEVNTGLNIMRLMKHDPQQALEALVPYVQQLQQAAGAVLPKDLQERVQLGEIDEQTAYETARLRARGQILETQNARSAQMFEQQQRDGLANAVGDTVATWEQRWKASDPDFAVLRPYVQREIELRLRRGEVPETSQQAEQLCDQVLSQVRQELQRFRPKPQAIRTPTGGASSSNLPKPASLLEAMSQALGR